MHDGLDTGLKTSERHVEQAIAEAKAAAHKAGLSTETLSEESPQLRLARRSGGGLTTFSLHLHGIKGAAQVRELEDSLCSIDGVSASVIYPTSMAWITAPDDVSPEDIMMVLADLGVSAELTRSSLQRRAERLEIQNRRNRLLAHRKSAAKTTPLRKKPDNPQHTRTREERLQQSTDVLFTPRTLVTPERLVLSILLSIPVLVLNRFPDWQWACLILATPVVLWGAWPFHRAALAGLRRGLPALDAASSVAIIAAYVWSTVMLIIPMTHEHRSLFLDVACGVTVLLLIGRFLSGKGRTSLLQSALPTEGLLKEVVVVRKDPHSAKPVKYTIPIQEIRMGDDIIVPTNTVIPVDGHVIGGAATVEPGLIGGGRDEIAVKVNSQVYAGGINRGGPLKIRVQRTGSRTRLAAMKRWVEKAAHHENRTAQLATRSASMLVPAALGLAAVDFLLWWFISGDINKAFSTALAILSCVAPVALALSTSLAMRFGIEKSARRGVLVRNGDTMRELVDVNAIIFNRVGTLSKGDMTLENVTAARGENPELVLRVAGALAMESRHPVSRALVRASREARDAGTGGEEVPHWIDVSHAHITKDGSYTGLIEIPLKNGDGDIEMRQVDATLWRPRDLSSLEGKLATAATSGGTPLVVSWKHKPRGVITLYDSVKDDAANAVSDLEKMGVETVMLSRDTYPVARRFADNLGISKVLAGIALGKKEIAVRSVHARGANVALVGETSVLDCMRVADVGILMGNPESLGFAEADVVVLRDDVSSIPELFGLARRVTAVADRNIMFAWVYNVVAMSLSVMGVVHPMAATIMMIGSSLVIETLSNRDRRC